MCDVQRFFFQHAILREKFIFKFYEEEKRERRLIITVNLLVKSIIFYIHAVPIVSLLLFF